MISYYSMLISQSLKTVAADFFLTDYGVGQNNSVGRRHLPSAIGRARLPRGSPTNVRARVCFPDPNAIVRTRRHGHGCTVGHKTFLRALAPRRSVSLIIT